MNANSQLSKSIKYVRNNTLVFRVKYNNREIIAILFHLNESCFFELDRNEYECILSCLSIPENCALLMFPTTVNSPSNSMYPLSFENDMR